MFNVKTLYFYFLSDFKFAFNKITKVNIFKL